MTSPLVRGLLRPLFVLRLVAFSTLLVSLTSPPAFGQTSRVPYRDEIVRLLQQLVVTGYPLDNEHDDGEWLQSAVNYAIHFRDWEIEHLAIRAAVPLRARATRPVGSTEGPPAIEVISYQVLKLPRPVHYVAQIELSLDGGPFIDLGSQASGTSRGIELRRLGATALQPGTHHVRLRARLIFGDPERPFHLEVRDLAPIAYALFDAVSSQAADARWFIHGPMTLASSELDPLLPSRPLLRWLSDVLSTRGEVSDSRMWVSRYCSELTDEHHAAHDAGGICAVIYFGDRGWMGQMWFRTGHVETSDTGASWHPAERPSLEALFLSDGRAASRLSELPPLLDRPAEEDPRDRSLSRPEVVITPAAPAPGVPAKATVTLHNAGEFAVHNVLLEVIHLDGPAGGGFRRFVVDIPAFTSRSVSLDVTFRSGYGLVFALPFIKNHGMVNDLVGPHLDSPCAVQVVNAAKAPRNYVRDNVGHMSHCLNR